MTIYNLCKYFVRIFVYSSLNTLFPSSGNNTFSYASNRKKTFKFGVTFLQTKILSIYNDIYWSGDLEYIFLSGKICQITIFTQEIVDIWFKHELYLTKLCSATDVTIYTIMTFQMFLLSAVAVVIIFNIF